MLIIIKTTNSYVITADDVLGCRKTELHSDDNFRLHFREVLLTIFGKVPERTG